MASARRILTYGMALVGLFAALFAASNLLRLLLTTLLLHGSPSASGDTRQELSLYLATLIVALPLWLGAATAANRRARQSAEERDARERRFFLAIVFAATSVVALFALQSLLHAVLALPGGLDMARGAIAAGTQLLVYGGAWLYHAGIGWTERSPSVADRAHDLAVYVLAGSALACLVVGLDRAVQRIVGSLVGSGWYGTQGWVAWSDIAAWVLAGGAVWGAVWRYDLRRGGRRPLRVLYLYLVLSLVVPSALWGAADAIYEALRWVFGYHGGPDALGATTSSLVIGGAVWLYHWYMVRAQAALVSDAPLPPGSIAWPRRPGVALLALLGHAITVPGAIMLLWLGLDALFNHGGHGSDWWRDPLSGGLAAVVVGGAAWLGAWIVLQRAAVANPMVERTAKARRLLLGGIVLLNALPAVGFAIALLWLLLRALLGERLDPDAFSNALKFMSASAILSATAVTHALLLRADLRITTIDTAMPRVRALVAAGAEEALVALRRCYDRPIEVLGQLSTLDELPGRVDLQLLLRMVGELGTVEQEGCDTVLVLLRPDGGSMHRYSSAPAKRDTPDGLSGEPR
jgi:hypothetical protein